MEIKETMDVLSAVKECLVAYGKAMEDGKINFLDAKYLASPISAIREAVKGAKGIGEELKDLDQNEISELVQALVDLIAAFLAASESVG